MAFYTYMLRCSDGSYYAGHTDDLDVRLAQHERGAIPSCYTYKRRPVTLVWSEAFPERYDALAAERRIRGWSRGRKEALIAGDWERVLLLARNRQDRERPSTSSGRTQSRGAWTLRAHPKTSHSSAVSVSAEALRDGEALYLRFTLSGDLRKIVLPPRGQGERRDGLWRSTCMEAFVRPHGTAEYLELNLAPSLDWASYLFSAYRQDLSIAPVRPRYERAGGLFEASLDLSYAPAFAGRDWELNLTTVIEETDGTKSYWAFAHPDPEKPDFHHPDGFVLALPAAS